ncbi:hypothetical protein CVT24_007185 [Panaeolus cyanescens]|uniref:FAS1 domain-containing protein n=1 Tax=Panaeolus cyanescens TaxID=181874 RepID=A0A409VJC0_9AGAR|nr:hypothetical protein CVT24_007185 [Panaeolus cyanescens]
MHLRSFLLSFILVPTLSMASASQDDQFPIAGQVHDSHGYVPLTTPKPTLADLLTIESSASIFYSYARELEISSMLSDKDGKVTVFVPTNKAVINMARKPHEEPDNGIEIEMTQEQADRRAKRNVERWVSAHFVPEYPLAFNSESHRTLYQSKKLTFKPISKSNDQDPTWESVTINDGIRILSKKEALNGDLYFIDGTILD